MSPAEIAALLPPVRWRRPVATYPGSDRICMGSAPCIATVRMRQVQEMRLARDAGAWWYEPGYCRDLADEIDRTIESLSRAYLRNRLVIIEPAANDA